MQEAYKILDKIQTAIIKANDEWENTDISTEIQEQYIQTYCQEAYLTALGFVDKYNLVGLRDYLMKEWVKYENDLLKPTYFANAEIYFPAVTSNLLYPVLVALTNNFEANEAIDLTDNIPFKLKSSVELLPHTAIKLNYIINDETSLDKLVDAFLTPLYPDLNSNPALSLPEGYRQPDSAIPRLKLLLEYKYLKSQKELGK